ncbi:hypothetical protein MACK_000216 [Theileria orientalis]|uniref:Uncharacterized protein n=1 Tax=Theileria orientalis TaxID=68886 RepID=A0A976M932_THEOR|nr:hypothetical protein MACK_000216 [Theileria orientalis]
MDGPIHQMSEKNKQETIKIDGLDLEEVEEMSERLSELDHESKSMLFLMCLYTFNELQNKFINNYKRLLQYKKSSNDPLTDNEVYLYTYLKHTRNNFLNDPLEEDDGSEPAPQPQPPAPETSLLRTLWRRYRIDFFIKVMLIIFLLKLPYIFFIITITVYLLYCLGFFSLIARMSQNLRNTEHAQNMLRLAFNVLDSIEPLLMMPFNQNVTDPRTMPTATTQNAQATQTTTRRTSPERTTPERTTPATQTSSATQSPFQHPTPDTSSQGVVDEMLPQTEESRPEEAVAQPTGEQPQSARQKPSYVEKFIYQVFLSFILSLLPWWEPNPIYLEE